MENKQRKSGTISFQPRARLIKLLGEELISDDVVAISELVKNAYDADATDVKVIFHSVSEPEGEIIVRDDGCGMDLETLLGCWMQPAASAKGRKNKTTSRRGRRLLGEKGVGRFAVDKLASRLRLVTNCRGSTNALVAEFDWDAFADDFRMLSDIKCRWHKTKDRVSKSSHGTELRMSGLRGRWNERMFRRMSARLCRLLSPFRDRDEFTITLESDDFPDYSGELRQGILDAAPYCIDAEFDGTTAIQLKINKGRAIKHPWNGSAALECGPVRMRIFAFDLESDALKKIGPTNEIRGWMKEWSGISIYRDAFRLWPYGEPHDDWLRLDQRRVNNPVVRLSNNQVVGFIDISRQANPGLVDQTNREGLVHNRALDDLRRFSLYVLQAIENERQRYRRGDLSGHGTNGSRPKAGVQQVGKSTGNGAMRAGRTDTEINQLLVGYSELAAVGSAALDMGAAVSPQLESLRTSCAHLRKQVKGKGSRPVHQQIAEMEEKISAIERRLSVIKPLEKNGQRRSRTIDVAAETLSFAQTMTPVLESRGIRLDVKQSDKALVRTCVTPQDFHRVLYILCANSLDWLHGVDEPGIRIINTADESNYTLTFSDNGPGVAFDDAERIFEPNVSCKEKGRGMGLAIANQIIKNNAGQIRLITDGRRRGANFSIHFPRKGGRVKRR